MADKFVEGPQRRGHPDTRAGHDCGEESNAQPFKERVADEAKKAAVRVHKEEVEAKKSMSSKLMHNADKWFQGTADLRVQPGGEGDLIDTEALLPHSHCCGLFCCRAVEKRADVHL